MTTRPVTVKGGWTSFQTGDGDDAVANTAAAELISILDTLEASIVVVRRDFRIACFNNVAADVLGLSQQDIGRPSRDVPVLAGLPRLEQQCSQVIAGGLESRIDFRHGDKWFVVRISPHTQGDQVTGTVLTFGDVTAFRASIAQAIYERECIKAIINTFSHPLVVLSADQRIQSGNRAFYTMFGVSRDDTQGVPLYELRSGVFELVPLREQLQDMLAGSHPFQPIEVEHVLTAEGQRTLILDAHPLSFPGYSERRVLVTFQDITEREEAEAAKHLRMLIDNIPGFVWTTTATGQVELVNRQTLEYFGKSPEELEELKGQATFETLQRTAGWTTLHPDDLQGALDAWNCAMRSGEPYDFDGRLRGADGTYRWFHSSHRPLRDAGGRVIRWHVLLTDIDDRKRAEESLKLQVQVLQNIPVNAWTVLPDGMQDFTNQQWLEYTGLTLDHLLSSPQAWMTALHPDDYERTVAAFWGGIRSGGAFTSEARFRRISDGEYRWHLNRGIPLRDSAGNLIKFVGTSTDIEDVKRAEEALRASERDFRLIVDTIPGMVCTLKADWEVEFVNQPLREYFGKTLEELKDWEFIGVVHPDDIERVVAKTRHSTTTGEPYEVEHRCLRHDGVFRWFQVRAMPLRDAAGHLVRWYLLLTDIEDRKRAEEALQASERELQHERDRLRLLLNLNNRVASHLDLRQLFQAISSALFGVFKCDFVGLVWPDASGKYLRQHMVGFPGSKGLFKEGVLYPIEASCSGAAFRSAKPVVVNNLSEVRSIWSSDEAYYNAFMNEGFRSGCFLPMISESRVLGVLQITSRDERAFAEQDVEFLEQIARQIAVPTKNALEYEQVSEIKERLRDENLALREQIDQAFMFEEIVGSSPALQAVLERVVKVAPTDSTVLISGETGTGKELIARAIHKRSKRSGHAFISVNCASIPPSLIASELFGHEKGAFTGALQQRQGRFELALSGTIFLDEIGELPAETQVTLLRVLQERQFERVGGNRVIASDVRVVAATNRDLSAAITAGTFRADLFYRLNVFPLQVPPLRKRKEDIPMLIEYFVKRFSEKMGKQIRKIDKRTFELCQNYPWPGNIRELQNIVERSVILSAGDTFSIDQAWLSSKEPRPEGSSFPMAETLRSQEKDLIEAALTECNGRVAGPRGAAARLGIPPSTLDRKIQLLKINKYRFMSKSE